MVHARAMLVLACLVACHASCGPAEERGEASKPSEFGFQKSRQDTLLSEGEAAYALYCVGCHGQDGDGRGEAAGFFKPTPRDFTQADFKFSSTRSGQLPRDDDLHRTIKHGLRGSAMPAFHLLQDPTIDALIAYIKTFSPKWTDREPARAVAVVNDPYRDDPDKAEARARGELVYHGYATCWTCHPAYVSHARINEYRGAVGAPEKEAFRDNLSESAAKPNSKGEVAFPPDFKRDFVRAGADVDILYRSIAAGITGTAMPTWVDSMEIPGPTPDDPPRIEPSDLWAVAYYVQDLIAQRPKLLKADEIKIRERPPKMIYLHGAIPEPSVPGIEEEDDALELDEDEFEDEFEG